MTPEAMVPWAITGLAAVILLRLIIARLRRRPPEDEPRPDEASPFPPFPRDDDPFTPGWRDVHVGFERDDLIIGGLKVWEESWRPVEGLRLIVPHPSYPQQRHAMPVYEMGDPKSPVRFAAGELSNGVWGFYVPE